MADRVSIAQARIDRAPAILKAYGLGSCIAVGLYDPETAIGGMGHMLLPCRPEKNPLGSESKYVDAGIFQMVDELVRAGAALERLVAKIAGGANMFETTYQTLIHSVGARNAKSARETLDRLGIPLLGAEVGGNRGRTVEFDLATGNMMVYCAHDDEQVSL
ncbi:MAG: chemotaxis protein CheD [Desulfuromonadales bacterium]|jgi:chemotaxis protein CheD|nr:chemotaxis protein CheD [Desulfuromonadales bacterium]